MWKMKKTALTTVKKLTSNTRPVAVILLATTATSQISYQTACFFFLLTLVLIDID
jgi:hypothetical protein